MSAVKIILYISLFLLGIASLAQTKNFAKQQIEQAFPIENSIAFDELRNGIKTIVSPKFKEPKWSQETLNTLESAIYWANFNGSAEQKILAQYYILMYYDSHLDDDKIIRLSNELLTTSSFMEMPESVNTLFALNSSYRRKGFYLKQLNILNNLIEQNKRFKNLSAPVTFGFYNELGLVYYNLEQYEFARNNFKQQANIFEKNGDYFRTSSMYNNIGLTYAKENILDSALTYYNKSLFILDNEDLNDHYYTESYFHHFKNIVKSNIVKIDSVERSFSDALSILTTELISSKKVKELSSAAHAYHSLANFYYENDSICLAKQFNDSTLIFEKKFHNPINKQKAYSLKARIALKQNDNSIALKYFNLADELKDSLNREKEGKNYSEATAKYNFIKTGEALAENRKLLEQKEQANTIQFFFLCFVVILGLIIGWMFLNAKKSNKLIAVQKEELSKGLKEKETMLDEIHHRIKNNLQVISGILELQRGKIDSKKYAKIYEESQGYLQSMSMIHEHLYEQDGVSTLDMQTYLNKLCDLLIPNYPEVDVNYEASAPTVRLHIKKATPLALIICELITNSLKHAFKETGTIKITLSKQETFYTLHYSDNGLGFENLEDSNHYNTGLNLILMLVQDLDGKVNFYNKNGFHCQLNFKD